MSTTPEVSSAHGHLTAGLCLHHLGAASGGEKPSCSGRTPPNEHKRVPREGAKAELLISGTKLRTELQQRNEKNKMQIDFFLLQPTFQQFPGDAEQEATGSVRTPLLGVEPSSSPGSQRHGELSLLRPGGSLPSLCRSVQHKPCLQDRTATAPPSLSHVPQALRCNTHHVGSLPLGLSSFTTLLCSSASSFFAV